MSTPKVEPQSYCYPSPERIAEGVRTLAGVIDAELELRETFGTTVHSHSPGLQTPGPEHS